ncbi:serine O-acetyltransferase EpsC [Paenirhodobacter sp.]|uniref:serine O-acetyltransferase EpsC n=1 Tax=Paenirhodobacter sp. TaxID=1965326 RepID=UPI003B40D883
MNSETYPHAVPAPALDAGRLDAIVQELASLRRQWRDRHHRIQEPGARELPAPERVGQIVEALRGALFPMRLGPADLRQENENRYIALTLDSALSELVSQVRLELAWAVRHAPADAPPPAMAEDLVAQFAAGLPEIRRLLDTDVTAAFRADPAARSVDEVLLCYPGIHALINHRIAHRLHRLGLPLIARLVSEHAHGTTGIDIHPGATIGEEFFIDHGTGVVIGATAIIGDRVQLFQAVTLGAKSFPVDQEGQALKGLPRHPIIEDDVVIYSGATVLGRVTIGRGSVLGGSVWVTEDVPPHSLVSQARVRSADQPAERRTA